MGWAIEPRRFNVALLRILPQKPLSQQTKEKNSRGEDALPNRRPCKCGVTLGCCPAPPARTATRAARASSSSTPSSVRRRHSSSCCHGSLPALLDARAPIRAHRPPPHQRSHSLIPRSARRSYSRGCSHRTERGELCEGDGSCGTDNRANNCPLQAAFFGGGEQLGAPGLLRDASRLSVLTAGRLGSSRAASAELRARAAAERACADPGLRPERASAAPGLQTSACSCRSQATCTGASTASTPRRSPPRPSSGSWRWRRCSAAALSGRGL